MIFNIKNRHSLTAATIFLYFLPIVLFFFYIKTLLPRQEAWLIWSIGLCLASICSLILYLLLRFWQSTLLYDSRTIQAPSMQSIEEKETFIPDEEISNDFNLLKKALEEVQEEQQQLLKDLEEKHFETLRLSDEMELDSFKYQKLQQEYSEYKLLIEEDLNAKDDKIHLLEETMERQRSEMDTRQQHISQLDGKIHELSHEIRTLLNVKNDSASIPLPINALNALNIFEESQPKPNSEDNELLKKCLQSAHKMTGAHYLNNENSRYREFSSSYYGIDQRRLFDLLRQETSALILVFSPKDHKPLFVNPESKTLLGWLPEKVSADFLTIIQASLNDWKKSLSQLQFQEETHVRLLAKTKEGNEVLLNTSLGLVTQGLFRDYIIAVAYPS